MEKRKKRFRRLIFDLLLLIAGVALCTGVLYLIQTQFTLERQAANSEIKFDIARQRLNAHQTEADEYLERYDAFSQAKADAIAFFYSRNPSQTTGLTAMASQWGLSGLYLLNGNHQVVQSTGSAPTFTDSKFSALFSDGTPVVIGDIRYYASDVSNGLTLVAGRNSKECHARIDELTDLSTALSTIKVGSSGHIEAVRESDNIIMYDPDKNMIGKTLKDAGFRKESYPKGYKGWIWYNGERYFCECAEADDDGLLFMSMVPSREITSFDITMVGLAVAVFAFVGVIMVIYIHLIRVEEDEIAEAGVRESVAYIHIKGPWYFNKTIAGKLRKVLVIGIIAIFGLSFYVQSLGVLSSQAIRSTNKQADIDEIFVENKAKADELADEYKEEYIGRAKNIAYLLGLDPSMADRGILTTLAQKAQIKYIYVFGNDGVVDATNSVYQDFALSTNPDSQSYEFWPVIRGYTDHVIQDATKDDTTEHGYLQYVGVTRQDQPGMVQLGISPKRLQARVDDAKPAAILSTIAVENQGFLVGIDKKSKNIVYSNDSAQIGQPATVTGLEETAFADGYIGYQTVNNQACLVSSQVYEDTIVCVVVPKAAIEKGRLIMSLATTIVSMLIIMLIAGFSLIEKDPGPFLETEMKDDQPEGDGIRKAFVTIHSRISGEERLVQTVNSRYNRHHKVKWQENTAEGRLKKVISWMAGGIGLLLVYYMATQEQSYDKLSILSYIVHQQWERVPSIFSFSYIAIVLLQVIVVAAICRKIIMVVSHNLGARAETIGRLIDSFVKYISVIAALFYCLNFVGVDSSTLLASAGLLSVVIGLGAQSLIGDIIAGIFIVFEGEFRVGDIITVDNWRGTVLEIGVRSTKVEDASGNIKILNNSKITGTINMTRKHSFALCDVGLEYDESLEHVEHVLKEELPKIRQRHPEIEHGPYYKGVVELADSAVVIRILAECQENDRIQLTRDLNREIKIMCDRRNIGMAFPQVVVHHPTLKQKATDEEIISAENFIRQQKEESRHAVVDDDDSN